MTTRATITRPIRDDAGEPILDSEGKVQTETVDVDRTWSISIGDELVVEDWDWDDVLFPEAIEIEAKYGGTFEEFKDAVARGSKTAVQILIWVLKKRTDRSVTLGQITMPVGAWKPDFVDVDVKPDVAAVPSSGAPLTPNPISEPDATAT